MHQYLLKNSAFNTHTNCDIDADIPSQFLWIFKIPPIPSQMLKKDGRKHSFSATNKPSNCNSGIYDNRQKLQFYSFMLGKNIFYPF